MLEDFLAGLAQLVLEVNVGGGEKGVNPRPGRAFHRSPGAIDIELGGAGQSGNNGPADFSGNRLNGFEVTLRGNGKARLQDIGAQALELPGHLELLRQIHAASGRLLPIAQCRVKNLYFVRHSSYILLLS